MDDNDLFALFWKCVAAVLITIILTVGGCVGYREHQRIEVLAKISNPALLQCSFNETATQQTAFCLSLVNQGEKK